MWVLSGPFDGEVTGECDFRKSKLLKSAKAYSLGRKDTALVINNKKISKEHCEFTVSDWGVDEVHNSHSVPNLKVFNQRDGKPLRLNRAHEEIFINGKAWQDLQDGDQLCVANTVMVQIRWIKVCCYSSAERTKSVPTNACAAMGIHVVHTHNDQVTHHLTPSFNLNPAIAASLLSACQFAKPEWLKDLIKDYEDESSKPFELLPVNKYRPTFSSSLPAEFKVFSVWEPNEQRSDIFEGFRFFFLSERGKVDHEWAELLSRAKATYEGFTVGAGSTQLSQALGKGKKKVRGEGMLVIVADDTTMKATIGVEEWEEFRQEIRRLKLHLVTKDKIIEAIVQADVTAFHSNLPVDRTDSQSVLPDIIPNSHPDEESLVDEDIPPRRRLTRQAASRQASQEPEGARAPPESQEAASGPSKRVTRRASSRKPSEDPEPARDPFPGEQSPPPPVRKRLTRRFAKPQPQIVGIDDPLSIVDVDQPNQPKPASSSQKPLFMVDLSAPVPARSTRLKRRAGVVDNKADSKGDGDTPRDSLALGSSEEPPLKKFKALFEATDPTSESYLGVGGMNETDSSSYDALIGDCTDKDQSLTQSSGSKTQSRSQPTQQKHLPIVIEDDEDNGTDQASTTTTGSRGQKRKLPEPDPSLAEVENALRPAKRRAPENGTGANASEHRTPAVESSQAPPSTNGKPPSSSAGSPSRKKKAAGAAPGQPDVDTEFLKAIASTKKGKKAEDHFDREFNQLRISKPEIDRQKATPPSSEQRGEETQHDQWAVLDQFGDDTGVRGNFMMVVEMDVYRRDRSDSRHSPSNHDSSNPEWANRPNFKKFKQKNTGHARKIVKLYISEDGGLGDIGLDGSQDMSTIQNQIQENGDGDMDDDEPVQVNRRRATSRPAPSAPTAAKKGKGRAIVVDDSDQADEVSEDESSLNLRRPSQRSKAGKATPAASQRNGNKGKAAATIPLFISSDEEDQPSVKVGSDIELDDDEDESSTLRSRSRAPSAAIGTRASTRKTASSTRGKAKKAVVVEDDSDDDGAFKGFGKRRR